MATNDRITLPDNTTLRILKLDTLVPIPGLAKSLNRAHCQRLDAWFNTHAVRLPIVTPIGNQFGIVKGKTTVALLKARGYTEWGCHVITVKDPSELFRLRYKIEGPGNRRANDVDNFRYAYRGGHDVEVGVWQVVVTTHGFHIPLSMSEARHGRRHNTISAVRSLVNVYRELGGRRGLDRTMTVLRRCFLANQMTQRPQTGAADSVFLEGLAALLHCSTTPSLPAVIAAFREADIHAQDILDEAHVRSFRINGSCAPRCMRTVVPCVMRDLVAGVAWQTA